MATKTEGSSNYPRRRIRRVRRQLYKIPLQLLGTLTALQATYSIFYVRPFDDGSSHQSQLGLPTSLFREETENAMATVNATTKSKRKLRFDYTNLKNISPLAKLMEQHQRNCSAPVGQFWYRNRFGLGSDLHVWSQALCNGMQVHRRVHTKQSWIWNNQEVCDDTVDKDTATRSAMACYFPQSEDLCPSSTSVEQEQPWFNFSRGRGRVRNDCTDFLQERNATVADLRAAGTEFLFTSVSSAIQNEAERQLGLVFGAKPLPQDLITVHIRWGDKVDEMNLVPVTKYIEAVQEIQQARGRPVENAKVFLATEDPRAVYEFAKAVPDTWKLFIDAYFQEMYPHRRGDRYNNSPLLAQDLNGRPGVVALGSLLVAMESNDFVITTASNWSRLIDELRKNIIDPRCDGCTRAIDLRYGEW